MDYFLFCKNMGFNFIRQSIWAFAKLIQSSHAYTGGERIEKERETHWPINLFERKVRFSFVIVFVLRDATSTTILQHFYNKSQVVSCYWFEFETNSKITFLSQQ